MSNADDGLTRVPIFERRYDSNYEWRFEEGDVRDAFRKVFSPGKDYVLFQTVVNIEAVDALKRYRKVYGDTDCEWETEKIQEGDLDGKDRGKRLYFSNELMDSYQSVISNTASEVLGEENFSHYPMVTTRGVHNSDRDPNAIFWPRVYIVDADKKNDLDSIIDNLSTGESFELLKERQSPQFYQMARVQVLNDLKIAPIVRLPQEMRVGADELSRYVDFFSQMTDSYKWTGASYNVD